MAKTNHRVETLARHLLSADLEDLRPGQRYSIERAVHRQSAPASAALLAGEEARWHERLADRVAAVGGSWTFICLFVLALLAWAGANLWLLTRPFDPYPFIFLNLLLSTVAAVQAPIIMMSQNRMAARDRLQASRDFEVNLTAELEIQGLHDKLDRLLGLVEGEGETGVDPVRAGIRHHRPDAAHSS